MWIRGFIALVVIGLAGPAFAACRAGHEEVYVGDLNANGERDEADFVCRMSRPIDAPGAGDPKLLEIFYVDSVPVPPEDLIPPLSIPAQDDVTLF